MSACQSDHGTYDLNLAEKSRQIAVASIIVDTHIDVPFKVQDNYADISIPAPGHDFHFPCGRAGGLDAPCMSIYTAAKLEAEGHSREVAEELIDILSVSSYDEGHRWGGLSPFGKEVVAEMNRLGVIIDVSHLSEDAFGQVMEYSDTPVTATRSS